MKTTLVWFIALGAGSGTVVAEGPRVVGGLKNPGSVVVGPGGKIYVTLLGERDTPRDGSIAVVEPSGRVVRFTTGLDDPKGIVAGVDSLYVVDSQRVWKVDARGNPTVFARSKDFPRPPISLDDIVFDGQGGFYVSDSGDRAGGKGAVFRIEVSGRIRLVLDAELTSPQIAIPGALLVDDPDHLLVADVGFGHLYRYDLNIGNAQRIGGGFGEAAGLARVPGGPVYVTDRKNGRLFRMDTDMEPPELLSEAFRSPADPSFASDGRTLLIPDRKAGTLTFFPIR